MPTVPVPLLSKPGIKRDGTRVSNEHHVDGQWVRWVNGRPRKMGGFTSLSQNFGAISRGMAAGRVDGTTILHTGGADRLEQFVITNSNADLPANRTPVGFASHANNTWSFALLKDGVDGSVTIVAHATPNGTNIDSTALTNVYAGNLTSASVLTKLYWDDPGNTDEMTAAGGVVAVPPYLFILEADGQLSWSDSYNIRKFVEGGGSRAGTAIITGSKLIYGREIRGGGGQSPAALFWSLDRLIYAGFEGGAVVWDFNHLADVTILSPKCVNEFNGAYYWPGTDCWYQYSGTLRELPNVMNFDWFYNELNWDHSAKVHGWVDRHFGEMWWAFPRGTSTECNHAVILNLRENVWYDTPIPNGGRSASLSRGIAMRYPLLAGVENNNNLYRLWRHEDRFDQVDGVDTFAVKSFYETSDISFQKGNEPVSEAEVEITRIEPDFVQQGDVSITIAGNQNARAVTQEEPALVIPEEADGPATEVIGVGRTFRQMRFRVTSNERGGYYEAGTPYAHIKQVKGRVTT